MSRIVPKLNLNKTPQLVENNSLIMAKNIRLLEDGTIGPDTSLEEIETKTGTATQTTVHHDAVTKEVTDYQYTILDCDNTIDYYNDPTYLDGIDLNNVAFNFSNYHPINPGYQSAINEQYTRSGQDDDDKYVQESYLNQCSLYCYTLEDEDVHWIQERFTYDPNKNELINNNGYRLYLAVYKDFIDEGVDPPAGTVNTYYYIVLPKLLLHQNIIINKYTFFVLNPVYRTSETETVVISPAYDEIVTTYNTVRYIGQIVGLNNKVYFFKEEISIPYSIQAEDALKVLYPDETFVHNPSRGALEATFDVNDQGYITRRGILFEDREAAETLIPTYNNRVKIVEYDEVENTFTTIKCAWKYSGGKINGCVTVNSTGEYILTICEYDVPGDKLVPIKHINLNKCKITDNESQYTQAPNIPISNLKLVDRYVKNIPAGVYQFFIRYKIHDNFYTNWFPCSKELYAGTKQITDTLQGSIKNIDLHQDSNTSFIFSIEHLFKTYCSKFEQYQLGFILSSDNGVFARSWKHFDISSTSSEDIYFEYNKEDIEEINIDDLLKVTYDIFNVGNITPYKNKLYISNYKETDFNENLESYAKEINVELRLADVYVDEGYSYYFNNEPLIESTIYNNIYNKYGLHDIKFTFGSNVYNNITIEETNVIQQTEYGILYDNFNQEDYYRRITKVYIMYNNTRYYIFGSDNTDVDIYVPGADNVLILNQVIDDVREKISGITSNGIYKAVFNNQNIDLTGFYVEYKTYDWDEYTDEEDGLRYVDLTTYTHTLCESVSLKEGIITSDFEYSNKEYNTLLPFTKYDFYVHYVKQNGVVTNGYLIGTKEITRYCKGYVRTNRAGSDLTVLDSIDKINDLCFYKSDFKNDAVYHDTSEDIYFYMEEEIDGTHVIYPYFSNIKKPEGYVACFISISKHGNNVAQAFNYEYDTKATHHVLDCLELDCLLYNRLENIEIIDSKGNLITRDAKYYSSSSTISSQTNPSPVHLGCSGHIEFDTTETTLVDTKLWIIFNSVNKPYNKTLIKVTPYIQLKNISTTYNNYEEVNTPGHLCSVMKLNRNYCDTQYFNNGSFEQNPNGYYVSGSDIYVKTISGTDIKLVDVTGRVDYNSSPNNFIYSNFNLNYVSLTQDLAPSVRRYIVDETSDSPTSEKQFITIVDSLICSFILELKSMYRDYTRKLYYEYNKNNITEFNNTIRVSNVDVDETYRYIYRFEATDYYHIPTQRGIITNLFAIANSVYVHCEHSLFKFSDNKTLNAQDEEVTLQENDIFNSGITEVFDAQYGYAGLKKREQSLITFNAYVFYDDVAQTIYAFGGEQQIGSISQSIKKLIDRINPTDVKFVGDELHNRFFVNLINKEGNICLSFNFNAKSFISIHDIDFKFGFHTRRHTYFIHEIMYDNVAMGWSIYRMADVIKTLVGRTSQDSGTDPQSQSYKNNYIAYQSCYKRSLIHIADCDDLILFNEVKSANACVDIIVNTQYEAIKALNYISWICSEIQRYGSFENSVAEEVLDRKYPGTRLRIYSDATKTSLFELLDFDGNPKIANENRNIDGSGNPSPNSRNWQYPQYNCGVWSMNYFRDIENCAGTNSQCPDVFDYTDSENGLIGEQGYPGTSETTDLTPKITREYLTQENSLLYGKYFVVRFIFNNKNFKLENLILRMNDYEKTK